MPMKAVKRGINVWAMSDAVNGYMSEFEVYTGRKANAVEKSLGANVVKTLTKPYINTYRHIYIDNFFTSIALLIDLLKCDLYACGTVCTNRKGFPGQLKTLAKKGLGERGRSQTFQHEYLTATVWQNNKPVPVVATNSDPNIATEVLRKKQRWEQSCCYVSTVHEIV